MLPKDKQLTFILIIITVFGCDVLYYYLTTKGIDIAKYQLFQQKPQNIQPQTKLPNLIKVTSLAFEDTKSIPKKYTCRGADVNPPLKIENIPAKAQTLVLIMEDPMAPGNTVSGFTIWTHWLVVNIPLTNPMIINENTIPQGAVLGQNDWGKGEYLGPCPPIGTHTYVFKVYALDIQLDVENGVKKADVLKKMEKHVLDYGRLVGLYP
jgi:Raf kinase inhibitor-like YbhB/YbcL family protein